MQESKIDKRNLRSIMSAGKLINRNTFNNLHFNVIYSE